MYIDLSGYESLRKKLTVSFFTTADVWAGTFWQEKSVLHTVTCSLKDMGRIKSS